MGSIRHTKTYPNSPPKHYGMIDEIGNWMNSLTAKLTGTFGERLIFAGLQGSYLRGEATRDSDIDVMVVLDHLDTADLALYRTLVSGMPEGEKACGFICGKEELAAWPKYELFQLAKETKGWYGNLAELLPPVARSDLADSVRIAAANLYHEVCHRYLYDTGEDRVENLQYAYKSAFFLLKLVHYLRTYEYICTKTKLLPELKDTEREILLVSLHWNEQRNLRRENPDGYYQMMLAWSGGLLKEMKNAEPEIRITVQAQ